MKRIIYGINPVKEALKAEDTVDSVEKIFVSGRRKDRLIDDIIKEARRKGIEIKETAQDELTNIAKTSSHQGILAFMSGEYPYRGLPELIEIWKKSGERAFFLLLDSIQDPQNMGALIRSAHAAGAHGVIVPKDRSCPVTASVIKASAGAALHTPIAMVTNLREAIKRLKDEGAWVYAIETSAEKSIYSLDLKGDVAIVIGSEGKGIRRLVMEESDFCAFIPMKGKVNSLNAAQAGTVVLFEARRQRDGA